MAGSQVAEIKPKEAASVRGRGGMCWAASSFSFFFFHSLLPSLKSRAPVRDGLGSFDDEPRRPVLITLEPIRPNIQV